MREEKTKLQELQQERNAILRYGDEGPSKDTGAYLQKLDNQIRELEGYIFQSGSGSARREKFNPEMTY